MPELNPRYTDPLLRSYFASHGGQMEFWPEPKIADLLVSDGLWFVEQCNRNPKSTHGATSCRVEVATLTEEGVRQGRKILGDFLNQFDTKKAEKTIDLLPFHVRSLFLCLLTRSYGITIDNPPELNSILVEVTNRVNLFQIPLPKPALNIIFDPVMQLFQYSTDKLTLYGLGVNNSKRHNVSGWQTYPKVFDTAPEIVKLLISLDVPYDELFLSHASQEILDGAPKQLAKLELLSRLAMSHLRKESILPESRIVGLDDTDVERITKQFVRELQKKGIVSKRDQWDRIELQDQITLAMTTPLVNDFISGIEKWWKLGSSKTKEGTTSTPRTPFASMGSEEQSTILEGQKKTPSKDELHEPESLPAPETTATVKQGREKISVLLGTDEKHNEVFWKPYEEVNWIFVNLRSRSTFLVS